MSGGFRHIRHEVVGWRSDAVVVLSVFLQLCPHVSMIECAGWRVGFEEAVIAAAGELAEHPTSYNDFERFRKMQLLTDAHLVLAACPLLGQHGRRMGQA